MDNLLLIEATDYTPRIFFDAHQHILEITGKSYPENTTAFYVPVFEWLKEYFESLDDADITVNLELVYFNSSSSKVLLDFFDLLNDVAFEGIGVDIYWFYEQDDEDMLEYGKEFQEDYRAMKFHFMAKEAP